MKNNLSLDEVWIKDKKVEMGDEQIIKDMNPWFRDPRKNRTKDTKYYKNSTLYWKTKIFLGKALLLNQE